MERYEVSQTVLSYFNTAWVAAQPTVNLVFDSSRPGTDDVPDPANPVASSWLRAYIGDLEGPNQTTYGGTVEASGHLFFQIFTPVDVGTGYADELLDTAVVLVRGKITGLVQFLPRSESFIGYVSESGQWWQGMARVPFWVPDDGAAPVAVPQQVIRALNGAMSARVYNTTTDGTPTELFTDGLATRLTLEAGVTAGFFARVVATGAIGTVVAHYTLEGTIQNIAGTTALVGGVRKSAIYESSAATYDAAATADDTNDALVITVTGAAHWEANVQIQRSV